MTSNRHYLSAGGQAIGVLVTTGALPTLTPTQTAPPAWQTSTPAVKLEVWHKDHLGSIAATTDHTGALTARYAYDPFGKRRLTNGNYDAMGTLVVDWSPAVNAGTDRGYTGHEQLDDVGLTHMNGRVFDATLGVFLQADPVMQDPLNLQNYNRYGYCFNNPLSCTDPSGFSFWTKYRRAIIGIAVAIVAPELVGMLLQTGAFGSAFLSVSYGAFDGAVSLSALGNFTSVAVGGFASGAVTSGSFEGGLQGAFTAGMFFGAGDLIGGTGAFTGSPPVTDKFAQAAIHGVVGCVTSEVGGGKCGAGAMSAAFSKFATVNGFVGKDIVSGTITSAVIGGTASALGGGSFANGATTAAFGYLFNCLAHGCNMKSEGYEPTFYREDGILCNGPGDPACRFPGANGDTSNWKLGYSQDDKISIRVGGFAVDYSLLTNEPTFGGLQAGGVGYKYSQSQSFGWTSGELAPMAKLSLATGLLTGGEISLGIGFNGIKISASGVFGTVGRVTGPFPRQEVQFGNTTGIAIGLGRQ